jgi:SAM-dependent methyltransferase
MSAAGKRLPYNKACGLEDFSDPELVAVLREVYGQEAERSSSYPAGAERRKHWEVAMSVRALRDFGALRPDADVLGVGAGSEVTIFHLTRHVRRVVATDLYLAPGDWEREAHPLMLVAPERLSPVPFERERLEALHMDGRWLRFPDASFDGIFSSGSIEHFGDFPDIAAAACEMGRVLKPGGVLSLSTELLLDGPPGAIGWPGVVLFSAGSLQRFLIEASGLEPVDEPELAVSRRSLATSRPLAEMIAEVESGRETFPHLVLSHDGQLFGSVHLTLRKIARYPAADNAWARPSEELKEQVRRREAEAEQRLFRAPAPPAPPPAPARTETPGHAGRLEETFGSWDAVHARSALAMPEAGKVASSLGFLRRTFGRVRDLGVSGDRQRDLFQALIDHQAELGQAVSGVEERLAALEAAVARQQVSDGEVRGAINEIREQIQRHGGGDNLWDQQQILRARQASLEGKVADLQDEIARRRG